MPRTKEQKAEAVKEAEVKEAEVKEENSETSSSSTSSKKVKIFNACLKGKKTSILGVDEIVSFDAEGVAEFDSTVAEKLLKIKGFERKE